jgi:hypothetical protein
MNAFSIELMGPEYVLMLVAWWAAAMVLALIVTGIRRAVERRHGIGLTSVTREVADDAPVV